MTGTIPNWMQTHWEAVQHFLKREWPKLTDFDLEEIDGEYDRLVSRIKELYGGPAEITQEAAIRGKVQRFLIDLGISS